MKNALVKNCLEANPKSGLQHRIRIGRGQKSLGKVPINQWSRRRIRLFRGGLCARHAMAAPQLRDEEFSGGPSPSTRRTGDEAGAIRHRDFLYLRSRGSRRQDPQQMVPGIAVHSKNETRQSALRRFY
jgi:hypothetical protein